ncbi:putative isomerase YddE [Sinobacterium norvegicum]|uniref:Isomerase YddE n=1 Tax=Sinobacterium norvegicum TaxID=1641715 RepID=A0ABM9AK11_9GAMM|nr:PhzF family phenazine biosynthesis protein [Sinobacterium norvegicum]CAH0993364.1 putative isomerase YddE [Sinobacterium norvegicum]
MKLRTQFVDAFTNTAFHGNSAAVIITEQWLGDELMQSIASENNLSETAFVVGYGKHRYNIRWFSPLTEVAFCGHATLAAAHVLFSQNTVIDEVVFKAKAVGELIVRRGRDGFIDMTFPSRLPKAVSAPEALLQAFSPLPPVQILRSEQAYFVVYDRAEDVLNASPDLALLKTLAPFDVVVTAKGDHDSDHDFISRYFWPANGGDEDPVTGSIHAGLAPYWSEVLQKTQLTAYQASARGGVLLCRVSGQQVVVSGQAVQYLEGFITLAD